MEIRMGSLVRDAREATGNMTRRISTLSSTMRCL